jgi:hypothetical protein
MMEQLKAPAGPPAADALEELRQVFADLRRRLRENPSFFIVITELALRARRDPAVRRIGARRDGFWVRRLQAILGRGKAEGLFRPDLDRDAATLALMVQMKGLAHHVAMGARGLKDLDGLLDEVAAQVEHWWT